MKKQVVLHDPLGQSQKNKYLGEVMEGLSHQMKSLPLKYNYDEEGSKLCSLVLQSQEFYLWKYDKMLIQTQGFNMLEDIGSKKFNLIDLGAGDGLKTKILINQAIQSNYDISYIPLDICYHSNYCLLESLSVQYPQLPIIALTAQYQEGLKWIQNNISGKNVYIFSGSNFGNQTQIQNLNFASMLYQYFKKDDCLLVGVDMAKNAENIDKAYSNNPYQKQFIINSLRRINKQLNGDFNISKFRPYTYYNPFSRIVHGLLISKQDQFVNIKGQTIEFRESQTIDLFKSKKWTPKKIEQLFEQVGFTKKTAFIDEDNYFGYFLFEKH